MASKNRKGVFIGAYLPPGLKESLQRRAKAEHRNLTQEITRILSNAVFGRALPPEPRDRRSLQPVGRATDGTGYRYMNKAGESVYLLSSNGLYKIGRSVNPNARRLVMSSGNPYEIELVCVIKCNNALHLEHELHRRYAEKKVRSEWFSLTPEDVEEIKAMSEGSTEAIDARASK